MSYDKEFIDNVADELDDSVRALRNLQLDVVRAGQMLTSPRAKEQMHHGSARRLRVIEQCLLNIFALFPPAQSRPLDRKALTNVQINLHAFVVNLCGVFENFAWAFVIRHDLEARIGGRRNVGMFLERTQRFLPDAIRLHVTSEKMKSWQEEYLKNYRDALAHRIPLYIPPSALTPQDIERDRELEAEWNVRLREQNWDRLDAINEERDSLGQAHPAFLHSLADGGSRPLWLHPQVICDARTILEFGQIFLANWHLKSD